MLRRCVLFSLVLVAGLATAAPVPKSIKPPPAIRLTLSADDGSPDKVCLTVANHTADAVSWQSSTIPLARFGIGIDDEKGKPLNVIHPCSLCSPLSFPGREYTVQPAEKFEMRFSLSGCFENGNRPTGKLTVTVAFTYGDRTYLSEPLEVK